MLRLFSLLFAALLTTACSSVPEQLEVAEDVTLITYEQANAETGAINQGQARWGGRIIRIANEEDNTVLELLHQKLNSSGRPQIEDKSQGRFRIYVQGYLEPAIYEPGRLITALGELTDKEQTMVGKHTLLLPVIYAREVHLWPEQESKETEFVYIPYVIHRPIYIKSQ